MAKIEAILVPIDGSDQSFEAAEYAISLAKMMNARIIAIHAFGIPTYVPEYRSTLFLPTWYDRTRKVAEEWLEKVHVMGRKEDVDVETEVIIDVASIVDAIVTYAKKKKVDLIVIGTKGRTGLKKFLLGSVASGVVEYAHCPVLVVR
jgi:nucleotide-binding universal stress UspA family protein